MILTLARHYLALTFNRIEPTDQGQRRYQRIIQATLAALAGKGIAFIVTFISVPLTVSYLGTERYGVWITISTLIAWLQISDLGLGNGLTNVLSQAYSNNRPDLAQGYVAAAFWVLSTVATLIGLSIALCWPLIDWSAIFNIKSALAQSEIGPALALAILLFLLNFPLSIIVKILGAYQEGALANYWAAGGSLASLVALLIVTQTQGGLVWLIVAIGVSQTLMTGLSAGWLFFWHKPWLLPLPTAIKRINVGELMNIGWLFLIVQVAALVIFQTDNLVIAHYLGAEQVTPYSVAYRLFTYTNIPQLLIFPYLWPAYVEAFNRNDGQWIKRTFRFSTLGVTLVTILLVVPLILFGRQIIALWAGAAVVPPFALLIWMGVWFMILPPTNLAAGLLNAAGQIKVQAIYSTVAAITNIILSITLANYYGITGVIAGTAISYFVCALIPQILVTRTVLRQFKQQQPQSLQPKLL